jgi:hypothetical protein
LAWVTGVTHVDAIDMPLPQDAPERQEEAVGGSVKQKVGGALYPDEVALAAAAFQAALASLGDDIHATSHSVRRCLAEYISAHALNGELDIDELRDGALRFIKTMLPAEAEAVLSARSHAAAR